MSLLIAAALFGCADNGADTATAEPSPYAAAERWLCRPDVDGDVCDGDLDNTAVYADGTSVVEPFTPAADPGFDCFYVYPTVSLDTEANADFDVGEEEEFMAFNQAARLSGICRVFAPVYRQGTMTALLAEDLEADTELAFSDVAEAWGYYLAEHNGGRGVLLTGHSQGSRMLSWLLRDVIEPDPAQSELVIAAHLIGIPVIGPPGQGDASLNSTPFCASADESGCVVSYLSYRTTEPPDDESRFYDTQADGTVGCNSPSALLGRGPALSGHYPAEIPTALGLMITGNTDPWAEGGGELTTPFFSMPEMISGECARYEDFEYLSIDVHADPEDPRADDLGGDVILPGWGLHVIDVNLAMADLSDLAERQAAVWAAGR